MCVYSSVCSWQCIFSSSTFPRSKKNINLKRTTHILWTGSRKPHTAPDLRFSEQTRLTRFSRFSLLFSPPKTELLNFFLCRDLHPDGATRRVPCTGSSKYVKTPASRRTFSRGVVVVQPFFRQTLRQQQPRRQHYPKYSSSAKSPTSDNSNRISISRVN